MYVSYVARDAGGSRIGRVGGFREAGGTLGEAAVILDDLPAQAGVLRTRIGPDGALYVGTTALGPREADDLGSYAGKVLRFTSAGVTPPDNPFRASPVFSFGYRGRLDFDWEPASGTLWHVETVPGGVSLGRPDSGLPAARSAFLEGIQATAVAFHAGATPGAWRGSLFLASSDQECLYRVELLTKEVHGTPASRGLTAFVGPPRPRRAAAPGGDEQQQEPGENWLRPGAT